MHTARDMSAHANVNLSNSLPPLAPRQTSTSSGPPRQAGGEMGPPKDARTINSRGSDQIEVERVGDNSQVRVDTIARRPFSSGGLGTPYRGRGQGNYGRNYGWAPNPSQ